MSATSSATAAAYMLAWSGHANGCARANDHLHEDDVHDDTQNGHREHDRPVYNLRRDEALHGLEEQQGSHHPDHRDAG